MRIDQFLQKTGIIKRRSLAKELCDRGGVDINGRTAKASHEVKTGDQLTVKFTDRRCHYRVLAVPEGNIRKDRRDDFVALTAEDKFHGNP